MSFLRGGSTETVSPITTARLQHRSKWGGKNPEFLSEHKPPFLKTVPMASSKAKSFIFQPHVFLFFTPWIADADRAVAPGELGRLCPGVLAWHWSREAESALKSSFCGFFKMNALKKAPFLNLRFWICGYKNRGREITAPQKFLRGFWCWIEDRCCRCEGQSVKSRKQKNGLGAPREKQQWHRNESQEA